jgi:HK97 family phage portal protein
MAWNSTENKSLGGNSASKAAKVGVGAPVANNANFAGRAYRDPWDIERAYKEGMAKVVWVSRCIDAIAGNQARLPVILRKDNDPEGEIVTKSRAKNTTVFDLLNTKSNIGENSFAFRYRLSSQLLMSSRGAFIEKVRGRDGRIIGLNLLPPQHTAPIPDPKRFVSGYEVLMPNGDKIVMPPNDVIWVRKPHPLDPYLSLTPMESAGIAIEIENLAKLYNRNYLLNDGRPGGLLVLKGEIDEDDKAELTNRFRGNLGRVGGTTVIASEDGVDYIDTSSSPRDAAYIQMRQITKEEILASFGVPESVIGNASGRTFSNAAEEIRVFWIETMMPHLEPLARSLDELDADHYVDFDTSEVPILVIYKQEREKYLLQELQQGLISPNEYRLATGKKKVKGDLADSLLMNPNLTPIANTEKEMPKPEMQMGGPQPGMPPGAPGEPPAPPEMGGLGETAAQNQPPFDPNTMQGALGAEQGAPQAAVAPQPEGQLADPAFENMETKEADDQGLERWTQILERTVERLLERQQRVIMEKAFGSKCKKALIEGVLDVDMFMPVDVWYKQYDEDIRPVLMSIMKDGIQAKSEADNEELVVAANAALGRIKSLVDSSRQELTQEIHSSYGISSPEVRSTVVKAAVTSHFVNLLANTPVKIAEAEARRAWRLRK